MAITKINIPTHCPSCKSELVLSSTAVDLFCPNFKNCPVQIIGRLSYFCSRNLGNIPGLSTKQIEKFVELYGVKDVCDLYELPMNKISDLEGFGQKSVENLKESIESSRQIKDYKFLAGLGVEGIGPEIAKLICRKI
jgi:DNA ligase (NAD+)